MSTSVIGLEGGITDDAVVVWGTAAISDGDKIHNSVTRRVLSRADAVRLNEEGHLHLFKKAIDVDDAHFESPLVVAMVNRRSPISRLFLPDVQKLVGVAKTHHAGGWAFLIFEELAAFKAYARVVAYRAAEDILYTGNQAEADTIVRHRNVIRNALSLAPSDSTLNALRVFFAPNNAAAIETIARSSLRGDLEIQNFEKMLAALRKSSVEDYQLKYEHGAARGGGFDTDIAAKTLAAITTAARQLQGTLKQLWPYLRPTAVPRLHGFAAASAHFYFVPRVEDGDLLGDRVARYLGLELLEEAIEGKVELNDESHQQVLETAVRAIVRPTPETRLRHKPLSHAGLTAVEPPTAVETDRIRSEPLQLLAVVSGLAGDKRVEIFLAPKLRFFASTEDDGNGNAPNGAETVWRDRSSIRRACVVSLVRQHDERGRTKYLLQSLRVLQRDEAAVLTAVPSQIVQNAFMVGLRMSARYLVGEDAIQIDGLGTFSTGDGSAAGVRSLIEEISASVLEFELRQADTGRWLRPAKAQEAPALARVLVALASRGGEAFIATVRTLIQRRFGDNVRSNNTRREVNENPDLLQYDENVPSSVKWTDRGRRYHTVYVAAGGATERIDSTNSAREIAKGG